MKHVVFKTASSTTDVALVSETEDMLWFKAHYFSSSFSYFIFKLTFGNTDVPKKIIEEAYDLTNSTQQQIQQSEYENNRQHDKNWKLIEKYLPRN